MNNEEKILSMLETISTTVTTLVSEQQKTNKRLDNLEQGQARLETEVKDLKQDVKEIQRVQKMDTGTIEIILGEVIKINSMNARIDSIDNETKENTRFISELKAIS